MPQPRKGSNALTTEGLDAPATVAYSVAARAASGAAPRQGSAGLASPNKRPTGLATPGTAPATPKAVLDNTVKRSYTGGYHRLAVPVHMAWKPNRKIRTELEALAKTDNNEKYVEDMIYFTNKDGKPATIDTIEDLMMLTTSIPPPHYLFEQERYFIFPGGAELTWEDPVFIHCGCVKTDFPVSRFFEDSALGLELWVTIVSMVTGGSFSHLSEIYDIRGLRITRKKSMVIEFWVGHKNPQAIERDGIKAEEAKKLLEEATEEVTAEDEKSTVGIPDEVLAQFVEAVKMEINKNTPARFSMERFSAQKFDH